MSDQKLAEKLREIIQASEALTIACREVLEQIDRPQEICPYCRKRPCACWNPPNGRSFKCPDCEMVFEGPTGYICPKPGCPTGHGGSTC